MSRAEGSGPLDGLSPHRFLGVAALVAMLVLGAMWGMRVAFPIGFLPGDYAIWAAKLDLTRRCELAPTLILGDSRAVAGIVPAILRPSVNLALTGAGPIEAYYQLSDIVARCPTRPSRIIISFIPSHFESDALFWPYAASFGLLDRRALEEIRRSARQAGDNALYPPATLFDLNGRLDALLYGVRFPSTYAASLIDGGLVRRAFANRALRRETFDAGGFHLVGTEPSFAGPSREIDRRRFNPNPLILAYFERLLALAHASGMTVVFAHAPINPATAAALSPALTAGFARTLDSLARDDPDFAVLNPERPVYPPAMFGDSDLHLNKAGSQAFTKWLARSLDVLKMEGHRSEGGGAPAWLSWPTSTPVKPSRSASTNSPFGSASPGIASSATTSR